MSIEIKSKEELVEAYRKINLDLTFGVNIQKNQPTAKAVKIVSKAYYNKPEFYYRYENESRMIESCIKFLENRMRYLADREEAKQNKLKAKRELVNGFKVGQILYDSWGYDQTNIDFYQVVELGAKSVKVRRIGAKNEGSAGFLCGYVSPDKDRFIGEVEIKIIQVTSRGEQFIKSRHGWISTYEGGKIYESHYA